MILSRRIVSALVLTVLLTSPTLLQNVKAASGSPNTLYLGVVTSSPLQSMSDLNSINNINQAFFGVLSGITDAVLIRPYYELLTANASYPGVDVLSTQTFPDNNTYILHLRQDTGWNNGKPVTAWDFVAYDTIIAGVGAPAYNYKVINNYTVSIQVPISPSVGLHGLSVSSFIFGPDLANGPFIVNYDQWRPVYNDVLANYPAIQAGNATVIQKMSAEIFSYKTSEELFSGAYYPTAVSPSEIDLTKNPHYYNTKNLSVDKIVVYQFTSASALFQYLDNGQLSIYDSGNFAGAGSGAVPQSYISALPSYVKQINTIGFGGPGIFFNNATGFVSNLHVRKAIAYALNRTELAQAGGSSYSPIKLPIGMPEYMWDTMCPASCQSQMNPYGYDLTAAANEMNAAGYTQQNGAWMSKNGTQVSLTLVNSLSTDPTILNVALDLQTQLQNFGITVNLLNPANPATYERSGVGFDMLLGNWGFYHTPWDVFRNLQFFNGIPYPVMHFTANVTIPGFGSTNAIALQDLILNDAKNITVEGHYAQGLSYLVNQYLPYLPLNTRGLVIYANTQQFNWPDASSVVWSDSVATGGTMGSVMYAQENGQLSVASTTSTSSSVSTSTVTSTATSTATSTTTATSTATTTATSTAISTTTSLTTSVGTSTVTSTSVQTSTVQAPTTTDYTPIIAVGIVIVLAIVLVGVMLARRRPSSMAAASAAPKSS